MYIYLCVYEYICVHVIIMLTVEGACRGVMGFDTTHLLPRLRPSTGSKCIVCYVYYTITSIL